MSIGNSKFLKYLFHGVFFLSSPDRQREADVRAYVSRFTTFPRERDFPRLESALSIILSRNDWSA